MAMYLSEANLGGKKIFIRVGSNEGKEMITDAEAIFTKFESQAMDDNSLNFAIIAGGKSNGGHWNMTWRESFALCYPWLTELE
ncbi:hypothetical protein [Lewinella sp. 4G2]|uniref:hypothetical protein n=1 Tax=Lewinella sp. 4G2 TaxID=1803372 RepID=UPI0012FB5D5D|nr:hypothetical protein [Lewinella sp. 4G2]